MRLTSNQKRFATLMDRAAIRAEVLSFGIGEAIKRGPDEKGLRVILDMATTQLLPAMREQDMFFNKAYPDRFRARTRGTPKPLRTAKKSAKRKKK